MKMNIKIFTVLILALTTMPGLAEICPTNTPGDTNENCKNKRDIYSSIMKSCAEWIKFNGLDEDIGNCEKDGTRYGHSKATHHKGCCFVFGNDTGSRDPIISLVETYNRNFNRYKAAPEELINEPITFGTVAQLNNWKNNKQPSITALETGYDALCKRNGANYEFKRQGETSTYICQGTKASEQHVQQSTPAPTNTNVNTNNNSQSKSSSGTESSVETIGVYDLKTETMKQYGFSASSTQNRKTNIKNIVDIYNVRAQQANAILPISEAVSITFTNKDFKGDPAIMRKSLESNESSIKAVVSGYTELCARNIGYNGVTGTEFSAQIGYGRRCQVTSCNETTHTFNKTKKICEPKPSSTTSVTTPAQSTTQINDKNITNQPDESKQYTIQNDGSKDVIATINNQLSNVALGSSISIPNTLLNNDAVDTARSEWEQKCTNLSNEEYSVIPETIENGKNTSFRCVIQTCKKEGFTVSANKKSCEKTPEQKQKEKNEARAAQATPAPEKPTPEPENKKSKKDLCAEKNGKWDGVSICYCNGKAISNLNDQTPVCVAPEKPAQEKQETDQKKSKKDLCTEKNGKWDGVSICYCNGKAIRNLSDSTEICHKTTQENKCDDQEVEHIIKEMATPKQDSKGNPYIEYSINYKTCDDLQQTWSEKCPDGTKSSITEDGNNIKLTCVPKEDSEVNENNELDFDAIVKAFEERAKQLKDQKCGQQQ